LPIDVTHTEILIAEHSVTDATVIAEFLVAEEAGKDPEAILDSLLHLGAKVAALGSSTANADKIEASVDQAKAAIREVAESFGDTIERQVAGFTAEDGTLITGFHGILDGFKAEIDEMTAGEDSPLRALMLKSLDEAKARIREDIETQVARQRKELVDLLDPSSPTSPLKSLTEKIDSLEGAVNRVHLEVAKDAAVAEVVEGGTKGGLDYEDEAVEAVQRLAVMAGDDCEPVGHLTGRIPRKKMGDAVVDLRVGATVADRMVVEAKNKALTKHDWDIECKGSKQNRGASGFLGLCKHLDDMPNGSRIVILDSRSIVLAYDPEVDDFQLLFLVYHLVRMNVLSSSGSLDEFNVVEIRTRLDEALKSLELFDDVTKQASAIQNAAAKIKKHSEDIRSGVTGNLSAALRAISVESNIEELAPFEPPALDEGEGDAGELPA